MGVEKNSRFRMFERNWNLGTTNDCIFRFAASRLGANQETLTRLRNNTLFPVLTPEKILEIFPESVGIVLDAPDNYGYS